MEKPYVDDKGILHYDPWVTIGTMKYNRDCLSVDDPNQTWNYLVFNGIDPQQYGIEHPHEEEFKDWSRAKLINELVNVRKEFEAYLRAGY